MPVTGQHVFFYARRTMETIAAQQGYAYLNRGDYHLFVRDPIPPVRRALVRLSLSRPGLFAARMLVAAQLTLVFAERDQNRLKRT